MINRRFKRVFQSSIPLILLLAVCLTAAPILAQDFNFQSNSKEQLSVTYLTKQANTDRECLTSNEVDGDMLGDLYIYRDGYVIEDSTGEWTIDDPPGSGNNIRARKWNNTLDDQWDCCPKVRVSSTERKYFACGIPI